MAGASEHITEPWGSIKCEKFREGLVAFSGEILFFGVTGSFWQTTLSLFYKGIQFMTVCPLVCAPC